MILAVKFFKKASKNFTSRLLKMRLNLKYVKFSNALMGNNYFVIQNKLKLQFLKFFYF